MLKFEKSEYCSGCGGCANVCPVSAIQMMQDAEGFWHPVMDAQACIECGKCEKVCPHLNRTHQDTVYGAWLYASPNDAAKRKSSSGAAFYELARAMLADGGAICGCAWDEMLNAVHIVGGTEAELHRIQGSKYVQSNTGRCYQEIMGLLKDGRKVLFSGTPCQAVALHNWAESFHGGKYRDNLITVAVICHGVASPAAWDSFKRWTEKKHGSALTSVNFRDKSKEGYKKSYCRYEYQSGEVECIPTFLPSSKYMEATLVYNLAIQNSCAHCDCKGIQPGIDLLIGDWYEAYQGEGALGTSCIVAFTGRGHAFAVGQLSGLRECGYKRILEKNHFVEQSVTLGNNRQRFFAELSEPGFWSNVERMYPPKYKLKKLLVQFGLFESVKKIIG